MLRWKEGLQQKAAEAFLRHQEAAPNLRKLVYGAGTDACRKLSFSAFSVSGEKVSSFPFAVLEADNSEDDEEELGGLFRVSRPQKSRKVQANAVDCSRFQPDTSHNWDLEEVKLLAPLSSSSGHEAVLCISSVLSDVGLNPRLFCYGEVGRRSGCCHPAEGGR